MIKRNVEQMAREDMFNVYVLGNEKKLPFTVTSIIDVILQYPNINVFNDKLALYFNSMCIRLTKNCSLLDIGYSPTEKLEIKNIDSKPVYFYLPAFNYTYSVSFFSNSTAFEAECYFAREFYTVPVNIFIEHQGKQISDDQYIFEIENSENEPFTISLKKGYQLYYCFFGHFQYFCLRDDSILRELKDTLSSKHDIFFGIVYGEKIKEYFKTSDPDEIDKSTTPISELSKEINIFDFDFDFVQEITPIPEFEILIEADRCPYPVSFNIDSVFSNSTIYLITCILERKYQIDRSLFIPYDQKRKKLELSSKIPFDSKIKFRIEKPFNVKIEGEKKQFSYLTTISDIKRIYKFNKSNFGIIINNQFALDQYGKCYLPYFLKNSDNPDEATQIYIKNPISPCHIRSFTNQKTNKTKRFIVPDFFTLKKTVDFYLRTNVKSLSFSKKIKNPNTFKYEFQSRATRNISIIFVDENNRSINNTIEVKGENPKIIDLLFAVYQEKKRIKTILLTEKYSIFEAFIKVNEKTTKLNFMQPLSELSDDENNKIIVKGYSYQKKKDDNNKKFTIRNNINDSSLELKYENISAKEIIDKVKNEIGLEGENFNLYMEYSKLNPDDHPLICKQEQDFLIFNESKETKEFTITNRSSLKVQMTVSQQHFHEISDIIIGMFNIVDLNNLKFRYLAYDKVFMLPRNFDAGSLPDNCEISVNYNYTKSEYATFSYNGETTKIELSNIETPISKLKMEIQEKLNKYDMTPKLMSFSFYKTLLDENKKFTEYKISENSKISIVKSKDSFSITVKTPEKVSHVYEVTSSDTSTDIKELIKSQYCYDQEIQLLDERKQELAKDQQLTPDMEILLNCQKAEIQSEGTLGNKKHLINEILSIKEANNYLKTKLNNCNISIFTFNENDNSFEIVNPDKKLFEIETKLFVHQLFKLESLYFGEYCIKIQSCSNEISECNTIEFLKKNIISRRILVPPEDFRLSTNKKKINENKKIYEIFNKDNKVQIKFQNKTIESDEKTKPKKRYKPTITLLDPDDSNLEISKSRTQDDLLKAKSERPKKTPKRRKTEIEKDDENNSNNEEPPEDFTKAPKRVSFSHRPKRSNKEKSDDNEKSDNEKDQSSSSEEEEKRENKKEKSDSDSDEEVKDNDEEKSGNNESESAKEELSLSEEEEKIVCNIQIGQEAVRTITLMKNATINDAKIKIAKEEDDIDPSYVSILFAGKKLRKTTVIETLKLTKDDILQVSIQNNEEILYRTAKSLQIYGDGNIEENYSEYDEESNEQETNENIVKIKIDEDEGGENSIKSLPARNKKQETNDEDKKEIKDGDKDYEKSDSSTEKDGNIEPDLIVSDLNNYEKLKKIGKGQSGEVFEIKDKKTGEIYAAKILFESISDIDYIGKLNLYRELNIMAKITHPNIVKFVSFSPVDFDEDDRPVIITEFVPNGSLKDLLNDERKGESPKQWDDTHKLITIYSIAFAMSFLHSHDIIHRDLKPANILMIEVDDKFYPKVADFGLSKMINSSPEQNSFINQSLSGTIGTPAYMSPEIIKESLYTKAGDVYSFGIIVNEIITCKIPFEISNYFKLEKKVLNGERPKIKENAPDAFKELIEACWKQDPSERPTFEKIVKELKENKDFITENVNEDEYFSYIDYIENHQIKYDVTRKIPSRYIKKE